jgi:hypothetical protein
MAGLMRIPRGIMNVRFPLLEMMTICMQFEHDRPRKCSLLFRAMNRSFSGEAGNMILDGAGSQRRRVFSNCEGCRGR